MLSRHVVEKFSTSHAGGIAVMLKARAVAGSRFPCARAPLPWRSGMNLERSSTPKSDPDHAIPHAQTSGHAHTPRHIESGADSSQHLLQSCLAPAASAVAPPALIFPARLPANTRYVNTTPCLSCPHNAHRKLTPRKDATPVGTLHFCTCATSPETAQDDSP